MNDRMMSRQYLQRQFIMEDIAEQIRIEEYHRKYYLEAKQNVERLQQDLTEINALIEREKKRNRKYGITSTDSNVSN